MASSATKDSMPGRNPQRLLHLRSGTFSKLCASAALAFTALSCDTPGIRLVNPDTPDRPTDVVFQVTLEDATLAEALGWERGVPGATVYLQRVGEPFEPDTLITDSLGQAHLPDILPGQFKVAAYRVLDENETGPTDGVVRAFGDGWIMIVGRGDTVAMTLVADKQGSLVFSEWYLGDDLQGYSAARYVELYNNSDTTVYLDGMLIGRVWGIVLEMPIPELSCSATESWRSDSVGIWSSKMHKFPGSGREYPMMPGQTVVVARDAVDHSVVHPGLPDLSDADFEFEGLSDADNPTVPNMPYLGPTMSMVDGSGMYLSSTTLFVATATEFEMLDRRRDFRSNDYARVPMVRLLDVVRIVDGSYYRHQQLDIPCALAAPRNLERLEGGEFLAWDDFSLAAHRRALRTTADGRTALQDVNTSFVDFVPGDWTPGRVEWWAGRN